MYWGLAQNRPSTSAKCPPNWITIKQLANHNKLDSKAHYIVTSGAGVQACREGCGKGALAPPPAPPPLTGPRGLLFCWTNDLKQKELIIFFKSH